MLIYSFIILQEKGQDECAGSKQKSIDRNNKNYYNIINKIKKLRVLGNLWLYLRLLGERCVRNAQVKGSSPSRSITKTIPKGIVFDV